MPGHETYDPNPPAPSEAVPVATGEQTMAETGATVVHPKIWHEFIDLYATIARIRGEDLSIITLDINSLKTANDELGHDAGNRLVEIVDRAADVVPKELRTSENGSGRPADLIANRHYEYPDTVLPNGVELPEPLTARIGGGDEFAIALPGTSKEDAQIVAERLVSAVKEELGTPGNRELEEVGAGVAVGVATLEPGMTASDTIREADRDMYRDKLDQLPDLTPAAQAEFIIAMKHLQNSGVRLRDAPKYIEKFGAASLAEFFEDQGVQEQG